MKSNLFLLLIFINCLGIVSCNTSKKSTSTKEINVGDNSMTSIDWSGIYQGILPCADCEGIKTQLLLNEDLTFTLKTQYLGKSDSVFIEKGNFKWNNSGSTITLDNSNHQIYKVGENILFHLDKKGKRISSDLAANYTLEKEKIEITNKYWKLIQLNGQPVRLGKREPFIRLNENKNVNGNSGCNTFNGKYELPEGNKIKFSPFSMTKMACIGNDIENEFMRVLENTTSYSVSSNELILQDEFETSLATFISDYFK